MYLNFYQMEKKPFTLAPDPEFLFLSQQHKDALGAIICGINERQGFVSVIGEVGTGKTTIIKTYLQQSDRERVTPVFIFNAKISFAELLTTYLQEIDVAAEVIQQNQDVNELVKLAYQALLELTKKGKNLVLIIDEAQNMPIETLANLCILSNFETTKNKLIQIILVGQPELKKKLDLNELRQLRQRILYKAEIWPLSKKESYQYFYHRLALVAKGNQPIFSDSAVRRIVCHAKGVPRVLNVLSENALVAGYGSQVRPISARLVKQVIADYEGARVPARFSFIRLAVPGLALLLGASLFAGYSHLMSNATAEQSTQVSRRSASEPPDSSFLAVPKEAQAGFSNVILTEPSAPDSTGQLEPSADLAEHQPPRPATLLNEKQTASLLKIVQQGDTLSQLCVDSYGFYNLRVHLWLQQQNPQIADLEAIEKGDMLFFPPMEPSIVKQMHELHRRVGVTQEAAVK